MFRIEHVWVCRCWLLHLFLTVQWDRDRPSVYVDRIINSCVCLAAFWVTLCAVRMCFRRFSLSKAVLESSTYQTGCRPKYVNSSKHTTIQRVYERFFFHLRFQRFILNIRTVWIVIQHQVLKRVWYHRFWFIYFSHRIYECSRNLRHSFQSEYLPLRRYKVFG